MLPAIAIVLAALAPAAGPNPGAQPLPAPQAQTATSDDPAARAGALFRDGEYAEAAAAFEVAYERTGDPALLFGRAQALRRAGNCGAAIEVFEAFIATSPPEPDVRAARDVIEACRAILGDDAIEPVGPVEPTPQPELRPAPAKPPRPSWPRDVAGGVLLGTGLAVAVSGAALYGVAFGRARNRVETEQAYEQRQRSVRSLGATGVTLLVTGGALLVGSVMRYALLARRSNDRAQRSTARHRALTWRF